MKKFEAPTIVIHKFDMEEVITSSECRQAHACLDCYCTAVGCTWPFECDGLKCPTLGSYYESDCPTDW